MPTTPEPKKRRSCLGSFFMGGIGCFAFGAGAILILVLVAPRILAGWVPGMVEDTFASTYQGTVEVGDVTLAWTARQELSDVVLRDPDGVRIGRATLVLPSILDLVSDGRKVFVLELEADLVADDDGVTNLARAFEPEVAIKVDPRRSGGRGGSGKDWEGLNGLDTENIELLVRASRLSWSDAGTRARGEPFELRELELTVRLAPGERKTLALDAVVHGPTPSRLELTLAHKGRMRDIAQLDTRGLELDVKAQGFSVSMVDGIAGMHGELVEMLGPSIDVALQVEDPLGANGRVSIRIDGEGRHVHAEGAMKDGAFRIEDDKPLSAALGAPLGLIAELLAPHLPEGAELVPGDRYGPVTFDAHQLIVPESSIDRFRGGDWLGGLRGLRGHFVIEAPITLYYTDPKTQASGVILGLNSAHMEMRSDGEEEPLQGSLFTAMDTGGPGDVELDFKLGRPGTNEPDVIYFDLQVRGVSSTTVDGYFALDGCFFEAMGASFGFRIEGDGITRNSGELMAFIRAPGISGNVHGLLEENSLKLEPEHGLNATFRPAPGWFERCIVREVGDGWTLNLLLGQDEGLRFLTDGTSFPLPQEWTEEAVIAALLEGWGKTSFKLGTWHFARTGDDGEEQLIGFEDLELAAEMDEEGSLELTLESGLFTGEAGSFRLHAVVPNAADVLSGGDASGIELEVEASGVSDSLLRGLLGPLLPEGVTLSIDTEKSVELQWKGGGFRRGALDPVDGLSGAVKLALGSVRYESEAFGLGLTDFAATTVLGGADVAVTLEAGLEEGPLATVLGDRVQAEASLLGPGADTGTGALEVSVTTPSLTGRIAGRLEGGGFATSPSDRIELDWRPTEAALRELLGASLAPGQSLTSPTEAPASLSIANLRLAPDSSSSELRADVELTFPTLLFRDEETGTAASILDLRCTAKLLPGEPTTLAIDGLVSGPEGEPAPLRATARALSELGGDDEPRFELELAGTGLPTPLVDVLARSDGLLVDVFGPVVDVVARSPGIGPRNGSFHVELVSSNASTTVDGELRDGVLTTEQGGGLDASLGLTPLFSKRVVGSLLPLVVDVEKPEGADPCTLRVHEIAFPLDGDLSRLDAVVELELGDVIYRLLPGFEDSFQGDVTEARTRHVRPLTVRIVQGVAHYDGLPIEIGGHDIGFRGSFGLVDDKLALQAEVPLAALGRDFAHKLERYGGSALTVPVRIGGTTTRPRFRVTWDALLKNSVGGLLDRWIRDH